MKVSNHSDFNVDINKSNNDINFFFFKMDYKLYFNGITRMSADNILELCIDNPIIKTDLNLIPYKTVMFNGLINTEYVTN